MNGSFFSDRTRVNHSQYLYNTNARQYKVYSTNIQSLPL